MQINKSDVIWNYAATFLKIAASALLLPFILRMMSAEEVGIWSVFVTVNSFISLLDFGFNPSFTRNITYIFTGVRNLKVRGFATLDEKEAGTLVDYGLLKGVISAMKWFYFRVAAILFLLLATLGTYYIYILLKKYTGNHGDVYLAWSLLCSINTYNLFSLYYDSLLQGKGLVKKSKQIVIVSQLVYIVIAAILIIAGKGLVAIVGAQASSVIIVRWLSHRLFFTAEIKNALHNAVTRSKKEILRAVYPNAVKIGLTTFGGIMVQRSAIVIGSLYLTLEEIASYGITMQLIAVLAGLGGIYTSTYQARIVQLRVMNNKQRIKELYIKGQFILLLTYMAGGVGMLLFGNWLLDLIGSQTHLMPSMILLLALFLSFEQTNLMVAGNILATKNEVPFFKASLISGAGIIIGLLISFHFLKIGLFGMLLIPLIVDFAYQAWKWPLEVVKDLKLRFFDFFNVALYK
ncbi:MAG: O-unit flippase-like protein [Ferruginibacter sp.]